MAFSTRTVSIASSLVLSAVFIGGAFLLSSPLFNRADAASTEEVLRAYAQKDTDADGLPDWQEALYHLNPENPHSVKSNLTDGEAVAQGLVTPKFVAEEPATVSAKIPGSIATAPATLTDRFGRIFLENYIRTSQGAPLSATNMKAFIDSATASLVDGDQPAYTIAQVVVDFSGTKTDEDYINSVERVLTDHPFEIEPGRTLDLFHAYTLTSDKQNLAEIAKIAQVYTDAGRELMKLSVPSADTATHLSLVNSLVALGLTLTDMSTLASDPLRGMLGVTKYKSAWDTLAESVNSFFATMHARLTEPQP